VPTVRELVIAGADFALRALATPEVVAQLRHPALLVDAGVRVLTKTVLVPVRFLFTARTGQVGRNAAAVAHFTAAETGLVADLARAALRWREEPPDPGDPMAVGMLERGLIPLYRLFLDEYAVRLREYGAGTAAHALEEWRRRLSCMVAAIRSTVARVRD
jgi:hypothetical protein